MSSLGKGSTDASDQTVRSNKRPVPKKKSVTGAVAEAGSADFGRPCPSFRQTATEKQAGFLPSGRLEEERPRGSQAARQSISSTLRQQVFKRDHFQCVNCEASLLADKKIRLEVDHIVPVSRGGTNDPHNLQTLCRNCNQQKKAHLI